MRGAEDVGCIASRKGCVLRLRFCVVGTYRSAPVLDATVAPYTTSTFKVAGLFFDKFTFTHSQASLLSMCTHPVESSQK